MRYSFAFILNLTLVVISHKLDSCELEDLHSFLNSCKQFHSRFPEF